MKAAVKEAIGEIESAFPGHTIKVEADPDGGAIVQVQVADYGNIYNPSRGPVIFHIVYTYPAADIYPHYLAPGIERVDKKPLGEGFHNKDMIELGSFKGPATMVSRRSNHWDPSCDSAVLKLVKVLDWMRTRP